MFRESDEKERAMHPSYRNKPVPFMQAQIQNSKFNEVPTSQRSQMGAILSQEPQSIPAKFDTYYDPNHPQADWSGLVKRDAYGRAHSTTHRSQQTGIVQSEHGLIAKDESQVKKIFDSRRRGEDGQDRNMTTYHYGGVAEPTFNRWETTHQRFERQVPTQRDQLTLVRRTGTKKQINDPAQLKPRQYYNPMEYPSVTSSQMNEMNDISMNDNHLYGEQSHLDSQYTSNINQDSYENNENSMQENSGSSRVYPGLKKNAAMSGRSFIHNIGEELVKTIRDDMPKAKVAGQMHGGNKSMILQNYRPLPGYTGKKMY